MAIFKLPILIAALFIGGSYVWANNLIISCENTTAVLVYPTHGLTEEGAYLIPKGSVALIDLLMRTKDGSTIMSGLVTRGNKKLIRKDKNDRWFMRIEDWTCTYREPEPPKQEL